MATGAAISAAATKVIVKTGTEIAATAIAHPLAATGGGAAVAGFGALNEWEKSYSQEMMNNPAISDEDREVFKHNYEVLKDRSCTIQ